MSQMRRAANALLTAIEGHPWNGDIQVPETQPGSISIATWIVGGLVLLIVLVLFIVLRA